MLLINKTFTRGKRRFDPVFEKWLSEDFLSKHGKEGRAEGVCLRKESGIQMWISL
jgi:hypothetical protein